MGLQLRSSVLVGVLNIGLYWVLSTLFAGVVFVRLPFEPIAWFKAMTHRGLPGEDFREAGFLFFFVLCNMGLRPVVSKLMGGSGSPAGGMGFGGKGMQDPFSAMLAAQKSADGKRG
jgi:hypothetical protein